MPLTIPPEFPNLESLKVYLLDVGTDEQGRPALLFDFPFAGMIAVGFSNDKPGHFVIVPLMADGEFLLENTHPERLLFTLQTLVTGSLPN